MVDYVALYGTQENPYSSNYDVLTPIEAVDVASLLEGIADRIKDEAQRLKEIAHKATL